MEKVTRVYTIEFSGDILRKRFERFLSLLHFNSSFGHSGLFAMHLDGDGSEKIRIKELSKKHQYEVDLVGGIGGNIEIATDRGYIARNIVKLKNNYIVRQTASLYKNGGLIKTIPSLEEYFD